MSPIDVVFCQVQPSELLYAHIVVAIETCLHARENKYWIGNITGRINGWCYREHIYGILIDVVKWTGTEYLSRPLPAKNYKEVAALRASGRDKEAEQLCLTP